MGARRAAPRFRICSPPGRAPRAAAGHAELRRAQGPALSEGGLRLSHELLEAPPPHAAHAIPFTTSGCGLRLSSFNVVGLRRVPFPIAGPSDPSSRAFSILCPLLTPALAPALLLAARLLSRGTTVHRMFPASVSAFFSPSRLTTPTLARPAAPLPDTRIFKNENGIGCRSSRRAFLLRDRTRRAGAGCRSRSAWAGIPRIVRMGWAPIDQSLGCGTTAAAALPLRRRSDTQKPGSVVRALEGLWQVLGYCLEHLLGHVVLATSVGCRYLRMCVTSLTRRYDGWFTDPHHQWIGAHASRRSTPSTVESSEECIRHCDIYASWRISSLARLARRVQRFTISHHRCRLQQHLASFPSYAVHYNSQ